MFLLPLVLEKQTSPKTAEEPGGVDARPSGMRAEWNGGSDFTPS